MKRFQADPLNSSDKNRWLHTFYGDVESYLQERIKSIRWDSDNTSLYVYITTADEKFVTVRVPFSKLSFDFGTMIDDVKYVVDEIKSKISSRSNIRSSYEFEDDDEYDEYDDPEDFAGGYTEWDLLESKTCELSDGSEEICTLWYNSFQDIYCITFGDPDTYYPENAERDFETDNEQEAYETFEEY